jgi:hypothetical protein
MRRLLKQDVAAEIGNSLIAWDAGKKLAAQAAEASANGDTVEANRLFDEGFKLYDPAVDNLIGYLNASEEDLFEEQTGLN